MLLSFNILLLSSKHLLFQNSIVPMKVFLTFCYLMIETIFVLFRNTDSRNGTDECKICYENIVDCVLYACGHMCLCYEVSMDMHLFLF